SFSPRWVIADRVFDRRVESFLAPARQHGAHAIHLHTIPGFLPANHHARLDSRRVTAAATVYGLPAYLLVQSTPSFADGALVRSLTIPGPIEKSSTFCQPS